LIATDVDTVTAGDYDTRRRSVMKLTPGGRHRGSGYDPPKFESILLSHIASCGPSFIAVAVKW